MTYKFCINVLYSKIKDPEGKMKNQLKILNKIYFQKFWTKKTKFFQIFNFPLFLPTFWVLKRNLKLKQLVKYITYSRLTTVKNYHKIT